MDSKNIPTKLGIIIILIFIFTVAAYAYFFDKESLKGVGDFSRTQKISIGKTGTPELNSGEHDCAGSPGHFWCEEKQKCVKEPEESCSKGFPWKTYTNTALGFEIKVPSKVDDGPIGTIENENIVWILSKNSTDRDKASQIIGSLPEFEKVKDVPWAIIVKNIRDERELESFVKNRYGKGCALGERTFDEKNDLYDFSIGAENPGHKDECFVNQVYFIKYSEKEHKAATWGIGQDNRFVLSKESGADKMAVAYDEEMARTFRFIR